MLSRNCGSVPSAGMPSGLSSKGITVKTIRWFLQEYRHEDEQGRYYLIHIERIWMSAFRTGLCCGLVPFIVYWILR